MMVVLKKLYILYIKIWYNFVVYLIDSNFFLSVRMGVFYRLIKKIFFFVYVLVNIKIFL